MNKLKHLSINAVFAVLICLFCACTTCNAFAANTEISLPPLNMSLAVPEGYITVTRETLPTDEIFSDSDISYDSLMANFTSEDIFLMCEPEDKSFRITISKTENNESRSYYDFNLLTDDQIVTIKDSFTAQEDCNSCTTYTDHPQALFFCPVSKYLDNAGSSISVAQYITIINGQRITVQLLANATDFTNDQVNVLNGIVRSIKFSKVTEKPESDSSVGFIIWTVCGVIALVAILSVAYYFFILRKKHSPHKRNPDDDFEDFLADTSIASWEKETDEEPDEPLVIIKAGAIKQSLVKQEPRERISVTPKPTGISFEIKPGTPQKESAPDLPSRHISTKSDDVRTSGVTKPEHQRSDIFSDEIDPQNSYSRPRKAAVRTESFVTKLGKGVINFLIAILFLISLLISLIIKPFTKNKKKKQYERRRSSTNGTRSTSNQAQRGSASATRRVRESGNRRRF